MIILCKGAEDVLGRLEDRSVHDVGSRVAGEVRGLVRGAVAVVWVLSVTYRDRRRCEVEARWDISRCKVDRKGC